MAERGFRVTAVDLDLALVQSYAGDYDWGSVHHPPTLIDHIPGKGHFHLITAFDVIEHLPDRAAQTLEQIQAILAQDGLILCTVPTTVRSRNRRQ